MAAHEFGAFPHRIMMKNTYDQLWSKATRDYKYKSEVVQEDMRRVAYEILNKAVVFVCSEEMTTEQKWHLYSETERQLWWLCGTEQGVGPYLKPVRSPSSDSGPTMYQNVFSFAESRLSQHMW